MQGVVDITTAGAAVTEEEASGSMEAEDDEDDGTRAIWYVLVPATTCAPELQCVTNPSHLYSNPDMHTPVGFGSDEEAARSYFGEQLDAHSREDGGGHARSAQTTHGEPREQGSVSSTAQHDLSSIDCLLKCLMQQLLGFAS